MAKQQLPFELVFCDLLPRLPAKSVGRFMCVSKVWYSLLKKPEFAKMHLEYITKNITHCQKILVTYYSGYVTKFNTFDCHAKPDGRNRSTAFPIQLADVRRVLTLGSCNGLVCAALFYYDRVKMQHTINIVIWNPLTGEYKKLESMTRSQIKDFVNEFWAFYYDESVKDYKILHVSGDCEAFMYALKANSWRKAGAINGAYRTISKSQGVFSNRSIYWIAGDIRLVYVVLSFDLNNENFKVVQLPVFGGLERLIVHQECLHALFVNKSRNEIELWRLNENEKDVWEKPPTRILVPSRWKPPLAFLVPFCFTRCEKLIVMCPADEIEVDKMTLKFELVAYDSNHNTKCRFQMGTWPIFNVITYSETLVSPNDIAS